MHRFVLSVAILAGLILATMPSTALAASHFQTPIATWPLVGELFHLAYFSAMTIWVSFSPQYSGYDLLAWASVCGGHSWVVATLFDTWSTAMSTAITFFATLVHLTLSAIYAWCYALRLVRQRVHAT